MKQGLFIAWQSSAFLSARKGVRLKFLFNSPVPSFHSKFIANNRHASPRFAALVVMLTFLYFTLGLATATANEIDSRDYSTLEEPILPIPENDQLQSDIIALGEKLFFDRRLSRKANIACADCHNFKHGGADTTNLSIKADGELTRYNTPSIFNVAFNSDYYWNASFNSLELEMEESVNNLDSDWNLILRRLQSIPEYKNLFERIFKDGISKYNTQFSLISFEKSLATPNSKFDRYLNGDADALDKSEISGYFLFKSYGCVSCHQGINIGGNLTFELSPTATKYYAKNPAIHKAKFSRTIKKRIRVPSLRNVAITAPYFHDGSISSLSQAVKIEGRVNSKTEIPNSELHLIVKFLHSLTGQYKGEKL